MAGLKQSVAERQPSAVLEQEVSTAEVPVTLVTPAKKEKARKHSKASKSDTDALLASTGCADTLADRIKAGSGRRRLTQSKTHIPSAAVSSLAEAVDRIIAPETGASERFMDSRDADSNIPRDIPGASREQQQHAAMQSSNQEAGQSFNADLQTGAHEQSGSEAPAKPIKKRKEGKGRKSDLLQTASQLAQGSNSTQDILKEDDKVTKRHRSRQQVKVEDASMHSRAVPVAAQGLLSSDDGINQGIQQTSAADIAQTLNQPADSSPVKPKTPKRKRSASTKSKAGSDAASAATAAADAASGADVTEQEVLHIVAPHKKQNTKANGEVEAGTEGTPAEAVAAAVEAVTSDNAASGKKKTKKQRVKATEVAVDTTTELIDAPVKGKRTNRKKKQVEVSETDALVEATDEDALITVTRTKTQAKAVSNRPVFEMPSREVLQTAVQWDPVPLPVPNLGYACLNLELRYQKPPIFTNRDMRLVTFKQKGMTYVSQLALENVKALKAIIQWNHEHGVRFFRMTSTLLPWSSAYEMEDLPDYSAIADELAFAGQLAPADIPPSHFVKLAAPTEKLLQKSLKELEILDLMGFEPSHWNKINIHIGGVYGDKLTTLDRFAVGFGRLSDNCKARLTVENDDWICGFSVQDLLPLSLKCNIPIVFDFHHHRFCPGDWSEQEAFFKAVETWPKGVRPVVHWSESQEERRDTAHSDYIEGPVNLHGKERDVDVMIEAKCMEQCLLRYRDFTMLGKAPPKLAETGKLIVNPAAELAAKFL
ncbi:MAG: UV damage endonuclease [Trebouxia sp. A1-2]|nr:MAG: UV damage endonuclease [Trebouxia sp. A1-2]